MNLSKKMALSEPCLLNIYFYKDSQLQKCVTAIEKICENCQINLKIQNGNHGLVHQDLKKVLQEFIDNQNKTPTLSFDVYHDVLTFTSASNNQQLRIQYIHKEEGSEGIFTLALLLNSDIEDVFQGTEDTILLEWKKLDTYLPSKIIPEGVLEPITVYYAISEKEPENQDVSQLIISFFPERFKPDEYFRMSTLYCGELYQLGNYDTYFLFSRKASETDANRFAMKFLPLLCTTFYDGNVIERDNEGRLDETKKDVKEVSGNIKEKMVRYFKKEPNCFEIEKERSEIFDMTKDLCLLNNNALQLLSMAKTVQIANINFSNIKKDIVISGKKDEIFCMKERCLELQTAQIEAYSAYLNNTEESGRVMLDSIEKQIELEYTKELKESNKKSLSLQSAAFIIEFVVVFYYFLGSWYYLLGGSKFKEINTFFRLSCATLIAALLCAVTHFYAEWRATKKKCYLCILKSLLATLMLIIFFVIATSVMAILHK